MARALDLALRGPAGLNPQVGCVLLDPAGEVVGEGWHEGAGTPHAEVAALSAAGPHARGATAVVTLEPCRHTGRTGPCTVALIQAGVARVVYGTPDPSAGAGGGASDLTAAGIPAVLVDGEVGGRARELLRPWAAAHRHGRPFVVWKFAATLDGRSAAADGTSRWITGAAARADVHGLRAACDTILVGTGTALADDPWLTVREPTLTAREGEESPGESERLALRQPLRAVMGMRDLPTSARVLDAAAQTVLLRTRDPATALAQVWERGSRRVWLEGGPSLAAAFLTAGLVDEVIAYVAPVLLGAGRQAVGDLGIRSIGAALRLDVLDVTRIGNDVRLRAVVQKDAPTGGATAEVV